MRFPLLLEGPKSLEGDKELGVGELRSSGEEEWRVVLPTVKGGGG